MRAARSLFAVIVYHSGRISEATTVALEAQQQQEQQRRPLSAALVRAWRKACKVKRLVASAKAREGDAAHCLRLLDERCRFLLALRPAAADSLLLHSAAGRYGCLDAPHML